MLRGIIGNNRKANIEGARCFHCAHGYKAVCLSIHKGCFMSDSSFMVKLVLTNYTLKGGLTH